MSLRADGAGSGTLLVMAHPDDECMFFMPTILALRDSHELHMLCLSNGDYEGLGATRKLELYRSCWTFGLPVSRVTVLDDPRLQDGPRNAWPPAHVASVVQQHMVAKGLHRLITFDGHGVSGHPNHTATHLGVRLLVKATGLPRVYELRTASVLRAYVGPLDVLPTFAAVAGQGQLWFGVPFLPCQAAQPKPARAARQTTLMPQREWAPAIAAVVFAVACHLYVLGQESAAGGMPGWTSVAASLPAAALLCAVAIGMCRMRATSKGTADLTRVCCINVRPWACHDAMRSHASQYVWYRRLHVLFSRYVWVNTLQRMAPIPNAD
jgi:LmbE family N-acetylglucosaminyl deacetylase